MPENALMDQNNVQQTPLARSLNGLLVTYEDDELNECINSALKKKSRVKYKCMDVQHDHIAFGTSGGAIYLFRLGSFNHSPCWLESMIPCDQGSVEVVRFLPNTENDDILIAIGTSRGSLVIFRVTRLPGDQGSFCNEIYRAESFTNDIPVKLIEFDLNFRDPQYNFDKIYICDQSGRIYTLDQGSFLINKPTGWRFYAKQQPLLIIGINNSEVNQISVLKSLLLISTHESSKVFYEQTCKLHTIGTKKRKEGFYGACFFDPRPRPQLGPSSNPQGSHFSSVNSVCDADNLIMFVARPMFRLWQINHERAVQFTHQFEPMIASRYTKPIELTNDVSSHQAKDKPDKMIASLGSLCFDDALSAPTSLVMPKTDHFHKLLPIHTLTLGNLILSYTRHEIFVIDPIEGELVVWTSFDDSIVQVSCYENEIFVWSQSNDDDRGKEFNVKRLVLFAPTQLILELHRTHRYLSLIMFVQMFSQQFQKLMALPLAGSNIVTTEGGLLRNVLLNAWDAHRADRESGDDLAPNLDVECVEFRNLIDQIIDESRQLKHSFENVGDSSLFLNLNQENVERLCSEPYMSLISLQVSIAELHTNHVIHFDQETINRHRSIANLSQNILSIQEAKQEVTRSNGNLDKPALVPSADDRNKRTANSKPEQTKVIVERQKPNRQRNLASNQLQTARPFFSPREAAFKSIVEVTYNDAADAPNEDSKPSDVCNRLTEDSEPTTALGIVDLDVQDPRFRCSKCRWPRSRIHCNPLSLGQASQLKWIQDNLMPEFDKNVAEIERRAFELGLWHLFLRCLAKLGQLEDHLNCCIMLDDIRLLDIEQLIATTETNDHELNRLLLDQLERKMLLEDRLRGDLEGAENHICLKCNDLFGSVDRNELEQAHVVFLDEEPETHIEDEYNFNLVNLLEQVLMRRNSDVKSIIQLLLKYPNLINRSKISPSFYLKAIATATLIAKQSPVSIARLNQLRGPNELTLT